MKGSMNNYYGRSMSPKPKIQLFDGSENDRGDPFDKAKETKYISRQISILDYSIFYIGLYTLAMSTVTWPMEFNEDYSNRYLFLGLCNISVCSLLMTVFLCARNTFLVKLAVYRKEASNKTRIWDLYWMPYLVAEGLFILIHPNWLANGYKIWIFDYNIGNYYFYHLNDIFTLILTIKCVYLITIIIYQSTYGSTRGYRVCGMFGCRADTRFILKCLLRDSPLFYIFSTLLIGIVFFGWISMICEAP
jgi:hypothetical protein